MVRYTDPLPPHSQNKLCYGGFTLPSGRGWQWLNMGPSPWYFIDEAVQQKSRESSFGERFMVVDVCGVTFTDTRAQIEDRLEKRGPLPPSCVHIGYLTEKNSSLLGARILELFRPEANEPLRRNSSF